jgi:hypothetical protein
METIITAKVLGYMPLSAEPLDQWNETETDLLKLLLELYNFDVTFLDADGTEDTANMASFGRDLYTAGRERAHKLAHEFAAIAADAQPVYASIEQRVEVPDFAQEPAFGGAAKSLIAWTALVNSLLEEGAFFSIAHVLEAEADLQVSFDLCSRLYYKQALQILRSYLEDLVLPIHFGHVPADLHAWKTGNYRVPPVRGRNGMIKEFRDAQLVSPALAEQVSRTYEGLNSAVHGSEQHLIHRGSEYRRYRGHIFKPDDCLHWCHSVIAAVEVGAQLLAINAKQWAAFRSTHPVICSICHNWSDFSRKRHAPFVQYECRQCGNAVHRDE